MPNVLYDAMVERDVAGIRAAVRDFLTTATADELFLSIGRFGVLAYAPSQHARHALLATLAAYDLRESLGSDWTDVLVECAIYIAQSRQPWSEPPMLAPPPIDPAQPRDIDELRVAVVERDRLRGERWLAARLDDHDLGRDYFLVASEDFEDLGHKLIVATAAWRLAAILGQKGRFAALRVGIREMTAYAGEQSEEEAEVDAAALVRECTRHALAERGSLIAMHQLFLFDSALQASALSGEVRVARRVAAHLSREQRRDTPDVAAVALPSVVYPLARDYGAYLKSMAVAQRLKDVAAEVGGIVAAAADNLENGPSFEEWSFA